MAAFIQRLSDALKSKGYIVIVHYTALDPSDIIREPEVVPSACDDVGFFADEIGPLLSPQFLSSDPGIFHSAEKFGPLLSPQFLCSDPGKFHSAEKYGPLSSLQFRGSDPGKFRFADKIGPLSSPQVLCSDPGNFRFADKIGPVLSPQFRSGYVQLPRSLLFDPNYKGAADRIGSDSAYKEAIQNAGMSGAGGSKGKGGEPTKDDEVANTSTMAWKLGLSVEAVTPNFIASAKISLEMKSGSGSNSKPPPLPPMPTPLVCKLYDSFLGFKKKFID